MAFAVQQTGFRTSVQSSRTAPFRANLAPPRSRTAVVTHAHQDPLTDVAKKAIAAVAAATIALSPLAANAGPLSGVLDQAGAIGDKATGAAKSATGSKASGNAQGVSGAIKEATASGKQGVKSAPSIGEALENAAGNISPDAKRVAGSARQGAKDIQNQPNVAFSGDARGLQINVGLPSAGGLADKAKAAGDKVAGAATDATGNKFGPLQGAAGDAKSALGDAKQGAKNLKNQPNVSFSGNMRGLQTNVGLPSAGGLADKAKAAGDKVAGAAKDATGSKSGPLQGAAGDAKSALGDAKQGVKDLKQQRNVSFARGLQVNVDAAYGGGGDKPASATAKSVGAAKDLSDQTAGPKSNDSGDAKTVDAAKRAIKDLKNQPMVGFNGRSDSLQVNVGLPSAGGLADKVKAAGDKVGGAAKDATGSSSGPLQGAAGDAKSALGDAKQGVKNLKQELNVAFSGNAAGLQKSVGLPSAGGLADKVKAAGDKVTGAAKDATGNSSGPLQGAAGDAKSALGDAKQGVKNLKNQPNVSYTGATDGLQVNVGVNTFGRGETGTTSEQAMAGLEDLKETVTNPGQNAKNAADRAGAAAERVLSNPTGGPEQSKRAAQGLADANAEVPRALQGGFQRAKDAITSPASFNPFGEAALQSGAALEA